MYDLAVTKNKSTPDLETLGEFLRRLRESKNISLREAARQADISSAYLSQVEVGKRGKRKKGEDHFGPHPQILKKLAEVYHVSATQLFERAGYIDDDQGSASGFSEEREITRIFDFVIHDPLLRKMLTVLDKRAIINRYEALTGKRLISWAGESETALASKAEFSGIKSFGGTLYADTPHTDLTIEEVAVELSTTPEEVKKMIEHHWLVATKDANGELMIEKRELQGFKDYAIRDGIRMRVYTPKRQRPNTTEEFQETLQRIGAAEKEKLPEKLAAIAKEVLKRHKPKAKK